jgi:hypothetical protein
LNVRCVDWVPAFLFAVPLGIDWQHLQHWAAEVRCPAV